MDRREVSCGKCLYFMPDEQALGKEGNCHRFPPQIVSVSAKTLQGPALVPGAMFPRNSAEWWCAEFRPREKNGTKSLPIG